MAYDLDEQEQLASLRAWWARYGTLLLLVLTLVLGAMAAINGWHWWQASRAREAASWFEAVQRASLAKDHAQEKNATAKLIDDYPRSALTARAVLINAASLAQAQDYKAAQAQLEWVIKHAKEAYVIQTAQLNLAGLQLDQKQFDAALKTLKPQPDKAFRPLYAEREGDIQLAAGRPALAVKAYQNALEQASATFPLRSTIEAKLDALGASHSIDKS